MTHKVSHSLTHVLTFHKLFTSKVLGSSASGKRMEGHDASELREEMNIRNNLMDFKQILGD